MGKHLGKCWGDLGHRKLVFHITHTVFLFCWNSVLPGQAMYQGQVSDLEHSVIGMFLTFLCYHMILTKATQGIAKTEQTHTVRTILGVHPPAYPMSTYWPRSVTFLVVCLSLL